MKKLKEMIYGLLKIRTKRIVDFRRELDGTIYFDKPGKYIMIILNRIIIELICVVVLIFVIPYFWMKDIAVGSKVSI